MALPNNTKRVVAPALPIGPFVYNKDYTDKLNNALRIYFRAIDSGLGVLMTHSEGTPAPADEFSRRYTLVMC